MSMTYIQLIQQCTLAIWGGGVTLNFYRILFRTLHVAEFTFSQFCISHFIHIS